MPGPTNPEDIRANENAVRTMVSLLGGIDGMVSQGVHLTDLAPILNADPQDDLSGLRLLASRMTGDIVYTAPEPREEVPIFPDEAKDWLLRTGRAIERAEGLVLRDKIDHLGLAALSIARGEDMGILSRAYAEVTNNRSPLSEDIIRGVASDIINGYREESD